MGRLTPEDVCPVLSAHFCTTNARALPVVFLIQGIFFNTEVPAELVNSCLSFLAVRALAGRETLTTIFAIYTYIGA
jgi:hypothetical protein